MMNYRWGWRQTLSYKLALRRAEAGIPFQCPWWADEQVYGLAYLQGKRVEISRDPVSAPTEPRDKFNRER
jgi:hypothetical protein